MTNKRYTEEFKIEAVKQITERGHAAAEVAARLGVSTFSLYQWVKRYTVPEADRVAAQDQQTENRRLKAELKRVTEERDILKKAPRTLPRSPGEVRIYPERGTQPRGASAMQDDGRASERLLRLVCHSRFEAHD